MNQIRSITCNEALLIANRDALAGSRNIRAHTSRAENTTSKSLGYGQGASTVVAVSADDSRRKLSPNNGYRESAAAIRVVEPEL